MTLILVNSKIANKQIIWLILQKLLHSMYIISIIFQYRRHIHIITLAAEMGLFDGLA